MMFIKLYEFYDKGSNGVDMLKDKGTKEFESWGKKEYIKLAKDNLIKNMLKTHGDFFEQKAGYVMALEKGLEEVINNESFKEQMKDAIDCRVEEYYRNRNLN